MATTTRRASAPPTTNAPPPAPAPAPSGSSVISALDALSAWERRNIMVGLQRLHRVPGVSMLMHTVGHIGTGEVLVTFFALLHWCIDTEMCMAGIWLVPVAEISNGLIKWQFQHPRPGWVDLDIEIRSVSHEYSFPSSHTMITSSLAAFFSVMRPQLGSLPLALCAFVGLSRVYEGAHYPKDVVVGFVLGAALGLAHAAWHPRVLALLDAFVPSMPVRALLGLAFSGGVYLLVERYYAQVAGTHVPSAWNTRNGLRKGTKLDPFYVPYCNYVAMCGVLTGLSVSEPFIPFLPRPVSLALLLARFGFGAVVLLAVFFGLRVLEKKYAAPRSHAATLLRFCRYGSVPPVIIFLVPALVTRLAL